MILPGFPRPMVAASDTALFNVLLATGVNLQAAIDAVIQPNLIIAKDRTTGASWTWRDTARGLGFTISSDTVSSQSAFPGYSGTNNHVAYALKSAPAFLDVVTYTGNGANNRAIPHALGAVPGMVVIKNLTSSEQWVIRHRSDWTLHGYFTSDAFQAGGYYGGAPDAGYFYVNAPDSRVNGAGQSYVAYVIGHDPAGRVQCGSYVGNGSTTGPIVNLGWEPAFLLVKSRSSFEHWYVLDNQRSPTNPRNTILRLNLNVGEVSGSSWSVDFLSTGFQMKNTDSGLNANTATYIYWAIRA